MMRQKLERRYLWLRIIIIVTAMCHLGGVLAVAAVGKDQLVPLVRPYIVWPSHHGNSSNTTVGGDSLAFRFGAVHTSSISMAGLVGSFFALSFLFQFLPAAIPQVWSFYITKLTTQCIQPFRWVEYSFSASCLFVLGDLINGVSDFYHVVVVFAAMWTVMMFGLLQELTAFYLRELERRTGHKASVIEFLLPHLLGWVLYLSLWFEALDRFRNALSHAEPDKPPAWVESFYVGNFVIFSSFGLNQLVEMVRLYQLPADKSVAAIAVTAEVGYVALSLGAKTMSGYFLLTGLLASSSAGHY
jgi:hypothetical protein